MPEMCAVEAAYLAVDADASADGVTGVITQTEWGDFGDASSGRSRSFTTAVGVILPEVY